MKLRHLHILILFTLAATTVRAQNDNWNWQKKGAWYASWGYSKWWYPKTDIHFDMTSTDASAKSSHTEYVLKDVYAHDAPWLDRILVVPLTVPQFCMRVGYFFNSSQTFGVEMTYDHAKFVVNTDQYVQMVGNTNGVAFDSTAHLYEEGQGAQPFVFKLNNGANFFEFTLVRKFTLFETKKKHIRLFYLAKSGAGWNTPHVENNIFGVKNRPHFQPIGGFNVGVEGAVRALFFNRVYLEFGQKGVYAAYYNLKLAEGTARVHFFTYGTIFSLGLNFPERMNRTYTTTNAE